jgi:hypothetical protein
VDGIPGQYSCCTKEKNGKSIACVYHQRLEGTILSQIAAMDHSARLDGVSGHHSQIPAHTSIAENNSIEEGPKLRADRSRVTGWRSLCPIRTFPFNEWVRACLAVDPKGSEVQTPRVRLPPKAGQTQ